MIHPEPTIDDEARRRRRFPRGSVPLFRIAGVRARLDGVWLALLPAVVAGLWLGGFPGGLAGASVAAVLLFASLAARETARAAVARSAGFGVREVRLFRLDGAALAGRAPARPRTELLVALAGPSTSFVLAVGFALAATGTAPVLLEELAWFNAALGVLHLVPCRPLDGGRLLHALVRRGTGSPRRTARVVSKVGGGLALALMVLGAAEVALGLVVLGACTLLFAAFVLFRAGRGAAGFEALPSEMTVEEALRHDVARAGRGAFPVVEGERPVGVVSADALRRVERGARGRTTVAGVMEPRGPEEAA